MGIFNEHSSNQHPFVKGLQGAPGVGFNLTVDGNYDMVGKNSQILVIQQMTKMQHPKSMLMIILVVEKHH